MRCQKCGSIMQHELTTTRGRRVSQCTRGIRASQVILERDERNNPVNIKFSDRTSPCGTRQFENGKIAEGYVSYIVFDNKGKAYPTAIKLG